MKVSIRRFEKGDIPNKVRWINDPRNNRYLHYQLPLEVEKTERWFEANRHRTDRFDAVIEADGVPVGIIGLLGIQNRRAEYYITLGEQDCKGKGIAKEASRLLLAYAKEELALEQVFLFTEVENVGAQRLFEKLGFRRVALRKNDAVNNGRAVDRYEYVRPLIPAPTPIQFLDMMGSNALYIKRDDLIPLSFGGNKARKALHFFEQIDAGGYDRVVTYGSSSSNHCRIVSNMAAMRGLHCHIISPEEASEPTANSRMMELFGAEITLVPVSQVHDTIENKLDALRRQGAKPYFIAGGGHGNLGTQAYVEAYNEIKAFEQKEDLFFDYIFFASGTGTTQAGLVCGQLLSGDDREILGISIARKNPRGRQVVLDSIREYLGDKASDLPVEDRTHFLDEFTGGGYAEADPEISETVRTALCRYGIPLDGTYTGKAWLGMTKYLEREAVSGKNILFIHTGGTPLFFDDLEKKL